MISYHLLACKIWRF